MSRASQSRGIETWRIGADSFVVGTSATPRGMDNTVREPNESGQPPRRLQSRRLCTLECRAGFPLPSYIYWHSHSQPDNHPFVPERTSRTIRLCVCDLRCCPGWRGGNTDDDDDDDEDDEDDDDEDDDDGNDEVVAVNPRLIDAPSTCILPPLPLLLRILLADTKPLLLPLLAAVPVPTPIGNETGGSSGLTVLIEVPGVIGVAGVGCTQLCCADVPRKSVFNDDKLVAKLRLVDKDAAVVRPV